MYVTDYVRSSKGHRANEVSHFRREDRWKGPEHCTSSVLAPLHQPHELERCSVDAKTGPGSGMDTWSSLLPALLSMRYSLHLACAGQDKI